MVVLVIVGLAAAVVAPAFGSLRAEPDTASAFAIAKAHATRRGDPLRLSLDASGRWQLSAHGDTTASAIARGADTSGVAGEWLISPAGHCLPLRSASLPSTAAVWDPIRCVAAR